LTEVAAFEAISTIAADDVFAHTLPEVVLYGAVFFVSAKMSAALPAEIREPPWQIFDFFDRS